MSICIFNSLNAGGVCARNCGQSPLKRDYNKAPIRACKRPPEICLYLGTSTGEDVRMFNCGSCKSKEGILTSVCYCGLFGKCLPFAPSQAVVVGPRKCADCPENPVNKLRALA